jgi:hypothetical protein
MMKLLTLALLTALITGCGTRGYLKEGATYDDFFNDFKACTEAGLDSQNCLLMKGWTT